MWKRFVVVLLAGFLAGSGVAGAGDGYSDEDGITVSDPTPAVGESITITAFVFQPGSAVTFTLFSAPVVLGTVDADDSGTASLTATIPAVDPGTHRIEASGVGIDGAALTVATEITVVASGGTGVDLPRTGGDSTVPLSQIAVAAIAGGGLLILLATRRRTRATTKVDAGV